MTPLRPDMSRRRCLGAAAVFLLLVVLSPNPSPLGKVPLVRDASAQSVSASNNQTGWGTYSIIATSNDTEWNWTGDYTLAACAAPAIPETGPEIWDGCGYAVGSIEGTTSGVACDSHLQYAWSVYVSVGYSNSSISLEVALVGPVGGFLAQGCGPNNNNTPPSSIPTYCCNESGLVVSDGVLSGVATYSKTGTDAADLPGFTVQWSGMVSVSPAQITTTSAPEFNTDALALAVIAPLAAVALITRRVGHKPISEPTNDRSREQPAAGEFGPEGQEP
jgi:hypothetical protein